MGRSAYHASCIPFKSVCTTTGSVLYIYRILSTDTVPEVQVSIQSRLHCMTSRHGFCYEYKMRSCSVLPYKNHAFAGYVAFCGIEEGLNQTSLTKLYPYRRALSLQKTSSTMRLDAKVSRTSILRLFTVWMLLLLIPVVSLASRAPSRTRERAVNRRSTLPRPIVTPLQYRNDSFFAPELTNPRFRRGALTKPRRGAPPPKVGACPSQNALVIIGCLLAANSGFLNGLTLSGLVAGQKQAVAAVTGAWTTSAIGLASGESSAFLFQLRIICCYFGGSCINGLLNPNGVEWSKKPKALLLLASLVSCGACLYTSSAQSFFALLAATNGLQNSWTSMLINGNVLRTAHFSGCTSDMGTFLGQLIRGNVQNLWKLKIFARLIGSFWIGGLLSVVCAEKFTQFSILGSVGLYLGLFTYLTTRGYKSQSEGKRVR